MTLAALGATLRLHRDPAQANREIPLLQLLAAPLDNLKNRAERLAPQIAAAPAVAEAKAVEDEAFLGGGSVPNQRLATWCVALRPQQGSLDRMASELRSATPAIVGRLKADWLLLDLRTVMPGQDSQLVQGVLGVR